MAAEKKAQIRRNAPMSAPGAECDLASAMSPLIALDPFPSDS